MGRRKSSGAFMRQATPARASADAISARAVKPAPRSAGTTSTASRYSVACLRYDLTKRSGAKAARRGTRVMTARLISFSLLSRKRSTVSHTSRYRASMNSPAGGRWQAGSISELLAGQAAPRHSTACLVPRPPSTLPHPPTHPRHATHVTPPTHAPVCRSSSPRASSEPCTVSREVTRVSPRCVSSNRR